MTTTATTTNSHIVVLTRFSLSTKEISHPWRITLLEGGLGHGWATRHTIVLWGNSSTVSSLVSDFPLESESTLDAGKACTMRVSISGIVELYWSRVSLVVWGSLVFFLQRWKVKIVWDFRMRENWDVFILKIEWMSSELNCWVRKLDINSDQNEKINWRKKNR